MSVQSPPAHLYKRSRAHFKAWLIHTLNGYGANLPDRPSFEQLQAAVEEHFLEPTRRLQRIRDRDKADEAADRLRGGR